MNTAGIGQLIVISGPSGVGKSSVVRRLAEALPAELSVSATTRQQSAQETNGKDYYFKSKDEFQQMIAGEALLEWAEYLGNYYGTPREAVEANLHAGRHVLLEIEVQGGKQVAKKFPAAIMVFLLPPSDQTLRSRLEGRCRDDASAIERRLANARNEIAQARESGVYHHWVVNDVLERAVAEVVGLVRSRS
jgi:guanylate kinase